MSTHEPTEENAKQKSEKGFLTLADKKPSLTRLSGNESMSARTVSTRELSDNLQRTRDGMINLMRKKQLYDDGLGRERISEGDDNENFDMLVRRKRQSKDSTRPGGVDGSFDDVTKGKRTLGKGLEEFDSEEFAKQGDPNSQSNLLNPNFKYGGGSKEGMFKAENSQKNYLGSDMSSNGFSKRFGKIFDDNDKRFTSQNPKKDGPLSARIFIDAFFPSLEGNRIFPVFNYRCAEKIQRASNNFTEKNRKRLNNQLAPVSSSTTMQEVEDDSRGASIEQQKEDLQKGEKILKVEEYQNEEVNKKEDESQKTEAIRDPKKVEEMEQQGKDVKKQKLQQNVESKEVVRKHDVQQAEELHKGKEVEETLVSESNCDMNRTNVVNNSMVDNGEKEYETATNVHQIPQYQSNREEPSAAEEELLQKVLRTLMVNEELIDFFCEKVIAKIAARNDFCGPNCKGICGGLNDPQKAN